MPQAAFELIDAFVMLHGWLMTSCAARPPILLYDYTTVRLYDYMADDVVRHPLSVHSRPTTPFDAHLPMRTLPPTANPRPAPYTPQFAPPRYLREQEVAGGASDPSAVLRLALWGDSDAHHLGEGPAGEGLAGEGLAGESLTPWLSITTLAYAMMVRLPSIEVRASDRATRRETAD